MPRSLPGLTAAILRTDRAWRVKSAAGRFERAPMVPAYHIDEQLSSYEQGQRAAQVVPELVQKLNRLKEAYGNWPVFDPGPYFDLYPAHLIDFCWVEETPHVLRVRLYADLLLPAFRRAERYWIESFLPAYHAGHNGASTDAFRAHLFDEAMPAMEDLLERAQRVVQDTLDLLRDDLEVLSCLGGLEERIQHRPPPGFSLAPGLSRGLQRLPREMPTLTLDVLHRRPEQPSAGREVWRDYASQQASR